MPLIVIGDRSGLAAACSIGATAIAHVGVNPAVPWLGHRRLARVLAELGRPRCIAASRYAERFADLSGAVRQTNPTTRTPPLADDAETLIAGLRFVARPPIDRPLIVPIAEHASAVPGTLLAEAAGVLAAGGTPVGMVIPRAARDLTRARSRASRADRAIGVIPSVVPPVLWLRAADAVVSIGADPDGVQFSIARWLGVPIVDVADRMSALSVATGISPTCAAGTSNG